MRRTLFAVAAGAAAAVALSAPAACTITLPGADGGAESDSGADAAEAAAQTVGDQCTTIFTELCTQAVNRCGLQAFSVDQCISADMPSCCTGSVCSETSKSSASDVSACTQQLDAEDCNALVNSQTPPACQGIPQKP